MALSFLGDLAGGLSSATGDIAPFAQGISSIMELFGSSASDKAYKKAMALQQEPAALYRAITDPNNPMLKRLTTDNTQAGMHALLMQLKQSQMMDSKRTGRNLRGTFFSPERTDETINYLLSRGAPAIEENARTGAINQMLASAGGLSRVNSMTSSAMMTQAAGKDAAGGMAGKIGELSKGIQGLIGTIQQPQQQAQPTSAYGPPNPTSFPWLQQMLMGQAKPNSYTYYG